jgi:hypothetical protein
MMLAFRKEKRHLDTARINRAARCGERRRVA